jgi:hypothetical protein
MSKSFTFLGDFCPSCGYAQNPGQVTELLRSTRQMVGDSSLVFVNLECCVTIGHTGKTTEVPIELTDCLELLEPVVANVANNHFFDSRAMSIPAVLKRLAERGVKVVGVYPETGPFWNVIATEGGTIGVISRIARGTHPQTWNREGLIMIPLERMELLSTVNRLRPHVDTVIVSLHWGAEYYAAPSPWQKRLALELCEAGVDVIWGHHAHRLQPSIMIDRTLLLYNLGNFLFGADSEGRWPKESDVAALAEWSEASGHAQERLVVTCADGSRTIASAARMLPPTIQSAPWPMDCLVWFLMRFYRELLLYGFRYFWRRVNSQHPAASVVITDREASPSYGFLSVLTRRVRRLFDLKADE